MLQSRKAVPRKDAVKRAHNQPPHHDSEVPSNTTFDADVVYLGTNEWLTIF